MTYQLIIQGERGKYGLGDCVAIDLVQTKLELAVEEAQKILIGDPSEWRASWKKGLWSNEMVVHPILSETDIVYLDPNSGWEVSSAWIVRVEQKLNIRNLKIKIKDWIENQEFELDSDPEYQKYLILKSKFEGNS